MKPKFYYKGYRYKLKIWSQDCLQYRVYWKVLCFWTSVVPYEGWCESSRKVGEENEHFIIRTHEEIQERIDKHKERTDKIDNLENLARDPRLDFVSRVMK